MSQLVMKKIIKKFKNTPQEFSKTSSSRITIKNTSIKTPGYSGFTIKAIPTGELYNEENLTKSGNQLYNALQSSMSVGTYKQLEKNIVVNLLVNGLELKVIEEMFIF